MRGECGAILGPIQYGDLRGFKFSQMFIWERFVIVAPKVIESPVRGVGEVFSIGGLRRKKPTNVYKPRAWRWLNEK